MKKVILAAIALVLCGALGFGGWKLYEVYSIIREEQHMRDEMVDYAPHFDDVPEDGIAPVPDDSSDVVLHSGLAAAKEAAGSVVGWLNVPGTRIDYPVAQGTNNLYYLKHDIKGRSSRSGAIFMDYRCNADYSLFNTIIYGHNMSSGAMFADLQKFRTKTYFDKHPTAYAATPTHTYRLEIFAYLTVPSTAPVYRAVFLSPAEKREHLQYLRDKAKWYRDIGVTEDDHLVTLSTCTYEFENARSVAVARIRMVA